MSPPSLVTLTSPVLPTNWAWKSGLLALEPGRSLAGAGNGDAGAGPGIVHAHHDNQVAAEGRGGLNLHHVSGIAGLVDGLHHSVAAGVLHLVIAVGGEHGSHGSWVVFLLLAAIKGAVT